MRKLDHEVRGLPVLQLPQRPPGLESERVGDCRGQARFSRAGDAPTPPAIPAAPYP